VAAAHCEKTHSPLGGTRHHRLDFSCATTGLAGHTALALSVQWQWVGNFYVPLTISDDRGSEYVFGFHTSMTK